MSSSPQLGICRLYEEFKRHRAPPTADGAPVEEPPNLCDWDQLLCDNPAAGVASDMKPLEDVDEGVSHQPQSHQHCHPRKRHRRCHLGHAKSLSVSGSNSTGGGGTTVPVAPIPAQQQRNLAVLDPKDVKRALRRAAVSGLFDLLSRHERRAHARDRWLMKRLKRTLGSFERSVASILARSGAVEGSNPAMEEPQEPPMMMEAHDDRGRVSRPQQQQQQHNQATANSAETATACVVVADSETVGGCALMAPTKTAGRATSVRQAIAAQSNCNNSTCEIDNTEDDCHLVIGCQYRPPPEVSRQRRPPVTFCSPSSTRTSCSVDSQSESGLESAAYSGYNISSQTPPSPPSPQSPKPPSQLPRLPFPRFPRDANCNHGTSSMRRQQQQQQHQQEATTAASHTSQLIYVDSEATLEPKQPWQQQRQQQRQPPPEPQQTPPRVDIYNTIARGGGPSAGRLHRAKPSGVRCHQCQPVACGVTGGGGGARNNHGEEATMVEAAMRRPPPPPPKRQRQRRQKRQQGCKEQPQPQQPQQPQQQPRCSRCETKPRPCPGRARRQQLATKRAEKAAKRQARCQGGERSCGDCRPPRISLCPADGGGNGRGAENFSRIRLQTQPGRFITRQVLFFDGSYLYQPVQPKGPCY